ncbi:hypothetical protein HYU15_00495 [Candidatus Woesearchaeota archaeon]|nr:hypothetical protein [Candidatus Woesearchaeota archaeon]
MMCEGFDMGLAFLCRGVGILGLAAALSIGACVDAQSVPSPQSVPVVATPTPKVYTWLPTPALPAQNEAGEGTEYSQQGTQPPAAPAPNSPPKIIGINAPSLALVGKQVTLEAIIEGTDGDEWEMRWEPIINQDGHTGSYLSSTGVGDWQIDGTSLIFTPSSPGFYGFRATATDKDGETTGVAHLPVRFEKSPFNIKGVAISFWGPEDRYDFKLAYKLIDSAREMGSNYVQLTPNWAQLSVDGSEIMPCNTLPYRWCTTPDDEMLRDWINYSHSIGLQVMLKPHLTVDADKSKPFQINPRNIDLWFREYSAFILHYAEMARATDVEMFSIGAEYGRIQMQRQRWEQIVRDVRGIGYEGTLTYSATVAQISRPNQRDIFPFDILRAGCRREPCSAIGLSTYYRSSNGESYTTMEERREIIAGQLDKLYDAIKKFDMPVISTELGVRNQDRGSYDPAGYDPSQRRDDQEAADHIEATLQVLTAGLGPRYEGPFIWSLDLRPRSALNSYDPRGRAAEEAIKSWFQSVNN